MAENKKIDDPKTLEGVVVFSVGDGNDGASTFTVVAVPDTPPPPLNPDDAVKTACERAAGGETERVGSGREGGDRKTSNERDWLSELAEADARLSAAAAAADAAVKRRIDDASTP